MKQKGFTLVELLVVLALIAILAAVLVAVIKPGEIFKRSRDTQRQSNLRNLAVAMEAYLSEMTSNPSLTWPNCNYIYFSTTTSTFLPGWPTSTLAATGSNSTANDGTGWIPINFSVVPLINLSQLPLDPKNGQTGTVNGTSVVFAYSFACDTSLNYEFAAKLEGPTSTMANDGGNENCTTTGPNCLYEVGPGRTNLY